MKTGIEMIAAERERQLSKEGYTAEHDDEHRNSEMLTAARCYLSHAVGMDIGMSPHGLPRAWPWEQEAWKPSDDPIRDRVKAAALIAADIDRLIRAESDDGLDPPTPSFGVGFGGS